jgi:uncharacterized protein (TIGR00661 family)
MGHAIRSRVVLEHLIKNGHEIEIMASGKAQRFLSQHFAGVNKIHGFHLILKENRVKYLGSLWSNILKGLAGIPQNIAAYFRLIEDFHPEAVITDFESWTYYYGKAHGLPTFSVDNMQVINRCFHSPEILAGKRTEFEITRAVVKSKLPFCDAYLITSFFHAPVRKEHTELFPPIIRREILEAKPVSGDEVLVYQSGDIAREMTAMLKASGLPCRIYGLLKDGEPETSDGNLYYRAFSEAGFIADLKNAKAVIASGGFTLMGEAVFLGKPMLAMPIAGQFEQLLNARYLEAEGYGVCAESVPSIDFLLSFLDRVPDFAKKLKNFKHDGNRALLASLDGHLEAACKK